MSFLFFTASTIPKSETQSVIADIPWDGALVGPSFDSSPDSVVVSVGSSAYLGCRVRQLGDRKVSNLAFDVLFMAAGVSLLARAVMVSGFEHKSRVVSSRMMILCCRRRRQQFPASIIIRLTKTNASCVDQPAASLLAGFPVIRRSDDGCYWRMKDNARSSGER